MGDLGDDKPSEKLDEQMWGSDDEDDKDDEKVCVLYEVEMVKDR